MNGLNHKNKDKNVHRYAVRGEKEIYRDREKKKYDMQREIQPLQGEKREIALNLTDPNCYSIIINKGALFPFHDAQ